MTGQLDSGKIYIKLAVNDFTASSTPLQTDQTMPKSPKKSTNTTSDVDLLLETNQKRQRIDLIQKDQNAINAIPDTKTMENEVLKVDPDDNRGGYEVSNHYSDMDQKIELLLKK